MTLSKPQYGIPVVPVDVPNTPTRKTSADESQKAYDRFDAIVADYDRPGWSWALHRARETSPEEFDLWLKRGGNLQVWEEAQRELSRLAQGWQGTAGRHEACRLENFVEHGRDEERAAQRNVVQALRELNLEQSIACGRNLIFVGPCGTGKDHLMHALARRVYFGTNARIQTVDGPELRSVLRAASRDGQERQLVQRYTRTRLLCISDPMPADGTGLTSFQVDSLFEIINSRWRHHRPTWATLNLPLNAIRDCAERVLSTPVWDRLRDGALVIRCPWRSFRRPGGVI